jgi:dipeptidyl aminopeptidase/acylaminoacyl peptidase
VKSILFALWLLPSALLAQGYQKPPKAVLDVLDAPPPPTVIFSPARDRMLLVQGVRYPSIADLAAPMLRLAGSRINPQTSGPHAPAKIVGLTIKNVADGKETAMQLPKDLSVSSPSWSPDEQRIAFLATGAKGIELWLADAKTGKSKALPHLTVNAAYGQSYQWIWSTGSLLVRAVPEDRGKMPNRSPVPAGPDVQENIGKTAPTRTFQDLLQDESDDRLFEYFMTSQLIIVSPNGAQRRIGKKGMYASADVSPDGNYVLVDRTVPPFSRLLPAGGFAHEIELLWIDAGKVETLASLPNEEGVPLDGVPTGIRSIGWSPDAPSTLVWVEALDGGDPKRKVDHRDKVMMRDVPIGAARELALARNRYAGISWTEKHGVGLLTEYERERQRRQTYLMDFNQPAGAPKLLWDLDMRDRYSDPGQPVATRLTNGEYALINQDGRLLLRGEGAGPTGSHPFLQWYDLSSGKTEQVWRCGGGNYETVAEYLPDSGQYVTRKESQSEPPNYYLHDASGVKALTAFKDPTPQIRGIAKQLVTYKRSDGVQCSFTLYLPSGYKQGTRLPTVIWAYPLEYTDTSTAGQVSGSTDRFTTMAGISPLFFLMNGYAVLYDVTIPIVGDPETVNDTFIEQLVSSAKAAIDKADEMGVTDPNRVGVMGHSYGAFMTVNLLAHCDLFKAGIAQSGAYNRTLTPFGFQSERRTLWQAPDMYMKVSPFMYADKIKAPLLMFHGEMDNNPGTFPIQSERLFQAIKGHGGTVRLVMLPYESHGYSARESVEHVLWERLHWFDRYVKGTEAANPDGR